MKTLKFASLFICLFFNLNAAASTDAKKELVLYNWEEYMPEEVLEEFYEQTGIKVRQVYYETDDLKDELIYSTNGKGMDLIIGSRYSFNKYADKGELLAAIPDEAFPNKKHIAPRWLDESPKINTMSTPFLWGTLGIIYRKDLVEKPVTSWMDLLKPVESLNKKIIMVDDVRDSMAASLLALGYSLNSMNPKEISEAGKLLKKQRPSVLDYRYIQLDETSELISGAVHMVLGYNGDAMILKEHLDTIEYVVPENGTQVWADFIGVFQESENKEAAYAFINFINDPKRAAFIAEELGSASGNRASESFMSEEHLSNLLIYPPASVVSKSEFLQPLSSRATRMYNSIYIDVTQ